MIWYRLQTLWGMFWLEYHNFGVDHAFEETWPMRFAWRRVEAWMARRGRGPITLDEPRAEYAERTRAMLLGRSATYTALAAHDAAMSLGHGIIDQLDNRLEYLARLGLLKTPRDRVSISPTEATFKDGEVRMQLAFVFAPVFAIEACDRLGIVARWTHHESCARAYGNIEARIPRA